MVTLFEQNLDDLDSDLEDWCGPSFAVDRSFTKRAKNSYAKRLEYSCNVYRLSAGKISRNQEDNALARSFLVLGFSAGNILSDHQKTELFLSFYMHKPTAKENGLAKSKDNLVNISELFTN